MVPGGGGHEEKHTGGNAKRKSQSPLSCGQSCCGRKGRQGLLALQTLVLWLVLGLRISGKKAAQGKQLEWIGIRTATVTIPDKKVDMI